jgi:tRNA(Ile)-lysidine synthase
MELLDPKKVASLLEDSKDALIGVSGGVDSMALLSWFASNKDRMPCRIRAMHVDHGEPMAAEWAEFTLEACQDLGVPCEVVKVDITIFGNNYEYAARQARYRAFCQSGADTIILAHHANDQCESFFLKLFRGSGVKGLKAMSHRSPCWYDTNVDVVRPMLDLTRSQIAEWAEDNSVPVIEDPSNADVKHDRNYIRHCIWPVIQDRFDIADINISRSIKHLSESWELTNMLANQDISLVTIADGTLEWTKVRDLGYHRIKNMLLRILEREGIYSFSINHIEQFAQGLLDADYDSRNELSLKGFTMNKIGKRIHVSANQRRAA